MAILLDVVSFIVNAGSTWYFFRLVDCFIPVKKHLLAKAAGFLLLLPVVGVVIYPGEIINHLGAFFLFIAITGFFFQGRLIQKLSIALILYPIIITVNLLIENIGMYFWRLGGSGLLLDYLLHLLFFALRFLLWWAVYRLFRKHVKNCSKLLTFRMWVIIDVICLAPFIGSASLLLITPMYSGFVPGIYPAMLACLITALGCIYLAGYIAVTVKISLENQNLRLQQAFYHEMEKNQREIRKLQHDMNHHLSIIAGLVKNGDGEKAAAFLAELSGHLSARSRTFCRNSVVNAVLNAKYALMSENGIDAVFHIDLDGLAGIDDISLCSLFANTMDNAIEASQRIADPARRHISVKARYAGGYFSYEIENAKGNPVLRRKDAFLSGKNDRNAHGFGLDNVRSIVEQYHGTLDISYDETVFSVVVLIGSH